MKSVGLKCSRRCIWVITRRENTARITFHLDELPSCKLYRASAYVSKRLSAAGILRIERFKGAETIDDIRQDLRTYGKEAVHLAWSFVQDRGGPAEIEVRQPLVFVGENLLQRARIMRGVANEDPQVCSAHDSTPRAMTMR